VIIGYYKISHYLMPWVLLVFQKSLIMKRYIGKVLKK